uniref:Uncharacterized protein n=1 Tax=Arundo donax TaxID=35708 RepID=A0A0A9DJK3_ARUDO
MRTNKILLSRVSKIVSFQLGAINIFLPIIRFLADILLLPVHMSAPAERADINKCVTTILVATEEKDLGGRFRLKRLWLWHFGLLL